MEKSESKEKKKAVLFAGTTEGRLLAGYLVSMGCETVVCVATEYGQYIMESCTAEPDAQPGVQPDAQPDAQPGMQPDAQPDIRQGRLDRAGMEALLDQVKPGMVIDATHPYAVEVTRNIRTACETRPWIRLLRCQRDKGRERENVVSVPDLGTAVSWLKHREGNILVTTGSKELASFCELKNYRQRVYARVLPSVESVQICRNLGYEGRHIIALQGPFSRDMNLAMIREYDCRYLVTKDGGRAGGLEEKLDAASRAGITAVLIDRPDSGQGISLEEVKKQIKEWMDHEG